MTLKIYWNKHIETYLISVNILTVYLSIIKKMKSIYFSLGCEFGGYCCDLARTWPVNGNFTDPQRKLYDLILSIQEHLIEICSEKPSLDYLFKIMCKELGKGLQHLGILPNTLSDDKVAKVSLFFILHFMFYFLLII